MRKFISALLTLAMLLGLAVPAMAVNGTKSDDIVILYTNDIHTYIDKDLSYDTLAAIKQDLQEDYEHVLLVDAGDHIQGTAYGSMDKGETIIKLMNAAGYDLATMGNHEFDYGMEGFQNVLEWAEFPYVSCNLYHLENGVRGENLVDSYRMYTFGDRQVAIIGVTTPETVTKAVPAYFQDGNGNDIYGISHAEDGSDLQADVQVAIDQAEAAGADTIIALGHLGIDVIAEGWTSKDVIANTCGLDAFIDGHSHSIVEGESVADMDGHSVLLTQTGEYFDRIGMMVIDADTGEITTDFIELDTTDKENPILSSDLYSHTEVLSDSDVFALKDGWLAKIETQLGTVFGSFSEDVALMAHGPYAGYESAHIIRAQETNAGDFCADALYYLFDNMELDVDVAIMNGGGILGKFTQPMTGDISYMTCKQFHVYGNVACLQTVTGQQILDALEWGSRLVGEELKGSFLQVSGLKYKLDPTIENTIPVDERGTWAGSPTGAYRVYDVEIYNKNTDRYEPLDLSASYNLAGYNYTLRDHGDGFAMFDGAVNVLDYVMEDYQVLANYVQAFEDGTVTARNSPLLNKYASMQMDYSNPNGSGRIYVGHYTFRDVAEDAYYAEAVDWAADNNITSGTSINTFSPDAVCTRAQAVTFLWRAAGSPEPTSTVMPFEDVAADAYYHDAVLWAVEKGITSGTSSTTFAPDLSCSRGQIVTFLWQAQGSPSTEQATGFHDVPVDAYYNVPAVWAFENGITSGTSATTFGPDAQCTRAQIVTFLWHCYK